MDQVRCSDTHIQYEWQLDEVPMLVDSGACVAMPLLILARALNYLCPGVRLNPPPVNNQFVNVNVANAKSMNKLGTLNVLFRFSGPNVKAKEHKGPVMKY